MPRKKLRARKQSATENQISQGLWEWLTATDARVRRGIEAEYNLNRFALAVHEFELLHPIISQRVASGSLKVVPELVMTCDDLEKLATECRAQEVSCE